SGAAPVRSLRRGRRQEPADGDRLAGYPGLRRRPHLHADGRAGSLLHPVHGRNLVGGDPRPRDHPAKAVADRSSSDPGEAAGCGAGGGGRRGLRPVPAGSRSTAVRFRPVGLLRTLQLRHRPWPQHRERHPRRLPRHRYDGRDRRGHDHRAGRPRADPRPGEAP
ncbi:hypothetical protein VAS14_00033 [Vibrio angustum S14]|nr:hypothetical protein VAS14_00033 [Vibrio angustum S14] [Photobacterium angustum S14]